MCTYHSKYLTLTRIGNKNIAREWANSIFPHNSKLPASGFTVSMEHVGDRPIFIRLRREPRVFVARKNADRRAANCRYWEKRATTGVQRRSKVCDTSRHEPAGSFAKLCVPLLRIDAPLPPFSCMSFNMRRALRELLLFPSMTAEKQRR